MRGQIIHANIVLQDGILRDGVCGYCDGIIDYVGRELRTDAEITVDAKGAWLLPGFIDIHCHGGNGLDFMDATPDEMAEIARFHLSHGTTTLLATTMSDRWEAVYAVLDRFAILKRQGRLGTLHGVHLEGPWLNPAQCGAQDTEKMDMPDVDRLRKMVEKYPFVERISAAPELSGGMELGRVGREHGLVMSAAHTDADFEQIEEAVENGYTLMTHLYSGMGMTVRKNAYRIAGAVEAGLYDDRLFVEVIADGRHLPTTLLKFIHKCKGADRICLITDAMRAAGLADGETSVLGRMNDGVPVIVEDGVAKLLDRLSFAGSVATTDRLLRVMHLEAGIDLTEVSRMLSGTPAKVMGYTDRGVIEVGKRADLVLLDGDYKIVNVYSGGEVQ